MFTSILLLRLIALSLSKRKLFFWGFLVLVTKVDKRINPDAVSNKPTADKNLTYFYYVLFIGKSNDDTSTSFEKNTSRA